MGVSRQAYKRSTFGEPFDLASLGFPADYVSTAAIDGLVFPRFDLGNGYSGIGPNGYNSYYENPTAFDVTGSLVKIAGAHSVKFGAEFRKLYENFAQYGRPSGYYNVDQSWTQDFAGQSDGTGNPFASLLLGLPQSGNMTHDPTATDASGYVALFVQDDWKITKNLTINMGLRWDVEIPRTDRFNQLSYWDPSLPSPIVLPAGSFDPTTCPGCSDLMGQMVFVGTPGSKYGGDKVRRNTMTLVLDLVLPTVRFKSLWFAADLALCSRHPHFRPQELPVARVLRVSPARRSSPRVSRINKPHPPCAQHVRLWTIQRHPASTFRKVRLAVPWWMSDPESAIPILVPIETRMPNNGI